MSITAPLPLQIQGFELLEVPGEGAAGTVLLADQERVRSVIYEEMVNVPVEVSDAASPHLDGSAWDAPGASAP